MATDKTILLQVTIPVAANSTYANNTELLSEDVQYRLSTLGATVFTEPLAPWETELMGIEQPIRDVCFKMAQDYWLDADHPERLELVLSNKARSIRDLRDYFRKTYGLNLDIPTMVFWYDRVKKDYEYWLAQQNRNPVAQYLDWRERMYR